MKQIKTTVFVLAVKSHFDRGLSHTELFETLEEAQETFHTLMSNSCSYQLHIKLGKATFELWNSEGRYDPIDFFNGSKLEKWLRVDLKSIRWMDVFRFS